jgi:hypothetical protein
MTAPDDDIQPMFDKVDKVSRAEPLRAPPASPLILSATNASALTPKVSRNWLRVRRFQHLRGHPTHQSPRASLVVRFIAQVANR